MLKKSKVPELDILAGLIREYYAIEDEYRRVKETREQLNRSIKEMMSNRNMNTYVVDNLKASVKATSRRDIKVVTAENAFRELGLDNDAMAKYFDLIEVNTLSVKPVK